MYRFGASACALCIRLNTPAIDFDLLNGILEENEVPWPQRRIPINRVPAGGVNEY